MKAIWSGPGRLIDMPSKTGIDQAGRRASPARRSGNERPHRTCRAAARVRTRRDRTPRIPRVGRADGEFVDVAVLAQPRRRSRIDFLARVVFLLREIEDIASDRGRCRRRRGAWRRFTIARSGACAACAPARARRRRRACRNDRCPDVPVASRNEVQADVAVADGDRRGRAALAGSLQPEHGLVEFASVLYWWLMMAT